MKNFFKDIKILFLVVKVFRKKRIKRVIILFCGYERSSQEHYNYYNHIVIIILDLGVKSVLNEMYY
jgi:hypothetical protein